MTARNFPQPVIKRNSKGEPRALLAYVRVDGQDKNGKDTKKQVSKEFPLGTKRSIMTQWQEAESERRARIKEHGIVSGTFAADVERYLALPAIKQLTSYKTRRSDTRAWVPELGELPRHTIRTKDVQDAMAKWEAAGVAAQTRRHRLNALRDVWLKLDKAAASWASDVKPPRKPRALPQALDYATINTTLNQLDPSAAKAELIIMAYCGFRPAEIYRTEKWMVTLDGPNPQVIRNTAKGGRVTAMPLSAPALLGWKMFVEHNGWKRTLTNANRIWKRAMREAGFEPVKSYALIHSFCTRLYVSTGDLQLVQHARGHADIRTTQIYAQLVADPRLQAAVDKAFAF